MLSIIKHIILWNRFFNLFTFFIQSSMKKTFIWPSTRHPDLKNLTSFFVAAQWCVTALETNVHHLGPVANAQRRSVRNLARTTY